MICDKAGDILIPRAGALYGPDDCESTIYAVRLYPPLVYTLLFVLLKFFQHSVVPYNEIPQMQMLSLFL
jgi:hypothetical protein